MMRIKPLKKGHVKYYLHFVFNTAYKIRPNCTQMLFITLRTPSTPWNIHNMMPSTPRFTMEILFISRDLSLLKTNWMEPFHFSRKKSCSGLQENNPKDTDKTEGVQKQESEFVRMALFNPDLNLSVACVEKLLYTSGLNEIWQRLPIFPKIMDKNSDMQSWNTFPRTKMVLYGIDLGVYTYATNIFCLFI